MDSQGQFPVSSPRVDGIRVGSYLNDKVTSTQELTTQQDGNEHWVSTSVDTTGVTWTPGKKDTRDRDHEGVYSTEDEIINKLTLYFLLEVN